MLSSNRRAARLSTISVLLALVGCPDPQGRYNEFVSRVPDAPVIVMADAPKLQTIPDITGTFLFSIFVSLFPTQPPLESIATVNVHMTDPPTADIHIQWLTFNGHTLIDRLQADYPNQAVDETGTFTVSVAALTIPGEAGFLGSDVTATNVMIVGTIKTADFFCGTVDGTALTQSLSGTTFGALRIQAGQSGSQLPAPLDSCAQQPAADGGL